MSDVSLRRPSFLRFSTGNSEVLNYGFTEYEESVYSHDFTGPVKISKFLEINFKYLKNNDDNIIKDSIQYLKKYYKPSVVNCRRFLYKRIPPIEWIPTYDLKQYLAKDLIGGITVGLIQIPQCMAYSLSAGLSVYSGLYVTFFNCLLYFLFGTSRHISPDTDAILSVMIFSQTNKYEGILFPSSFYNKTTAQLQENPNFISNDPVAARLLIASVISLSSGILLVI